MPPVDCKTLTKPDGVVQLVTITVQGKHNRALQIEIGILEMPKCSPEIAKEWGESIMSPTQVILIMAIKLFHIKKLYKLKRETSIHEKGKKELVTKNSRPAV